MTIKNMLLCALFLTFPMNAAEVKESSDTSFDFLELFVEATQKEEDLFVDGLGWRSADILELVTPHGRRYIYDISTQKCVANDDNEPFCEKIRITRNNSNAPLVKLYSTNLSTQVIRQNEVTVNRAGKSYTFNLDRTEIVSWGQDTLHAVASKNGVMIYGSKKNCAHQLDFTDYTKPANSNDRSDISWSQNGRRLATTDGQIITVWNYANPVADKILSIQKITEEEGGITALSLNSEGNRLAVGLYKPMDAKNSKKGESRFKIYRVQAQYSEDD